jgi:hypothetical protein
VDVLRRVLVQNYTRIITADGREVIRRQEKEPEGDGLPHGHIRIASPYDTDARWGVKREEFWLGYKLHVTKACDDAPPCTCALAAAGPGRARADRRGHAGGCAQPTFPNLITHVATTEATVPDSQMTGVIDDDLARKNLPPDGITLIRATSAPPWWSPSTPGTGSRSSGRCSPAPPPRPAPATATPAPTSP